MPFPPRSHAADVASFVDSVARSLKEHIPADVSIPNFVLELGDFPTSLKALKDLALLTKTGSLKAFRGRVGWPRPPRKTIADAWLAVNFGILPLVSDVRNFMASHDNVERRIRHLKDTYKKEVPFRRSRKFLFNFDSGPWVRNDYLYSSNVPFGTSKRRDFGRKVVTVTCGGTIYHTLSGFGDLDKKFLSLLASYGFMKPLSVIWEATPFSFLADYVTNIGDIVNSHSLPVFDGEITLRDVWTTVKVENEWNVDFLYTHQLGEKVSSPMYRTLKTEFTRYPGLPTSKGVKFDSDLSLNQVLNIVALLQ